MSYISTDAFKINYTIKYREKNLFFDIYNAINMVPEDSFILRLGRL